MSKHADPEKSSHGKAVSCPLKKRCRLEVISPNTMLVQCQLEEPGTCPNAFKLGKISYCEALFSTHKT